MTESVFEIFAEGGSLIIERVKNPNGVKFFYHHSEFDPTDEGLDINKGGEFENFEQPFQLINSKYPWFKLHVEKVHEDYRDYVLSELIKVLNKKCLSPDELRHSKQNLEKSLNVKLEFGNIPVRSGMQNIKVTSLMKITEYNYQEYTEESGKSDRIRGKYELWTEDEFEYPENMGMLNSEYGFKTIGKLEVNGDTIIIKNEFGQIEYAFPSDKFFVTTTSRLSQSKGWFYKSL